MAVFERETVVEAPLEEVWAFHSSVEGLVAVTPGWLGLRVESVTGPDGEADPEELVVGSRVALSVRPLGIGPRQSWVSEITHRERGERTARFRDRMVEGPFPEWDHVHEFEGVDGATVVRDRVRYRAPLGRLPTLAARPFLEGMFRARHRRTRAHLSGR